PPLSRIGTKISGLRRSSCAGLTRASIFFARRIVAKRMDCRVKPGNDSLILAPMHFRGHERMECFDFTGTRCRFRAMRSRASLSVEFEGSVDKRADAHKKRTVAAFVLRKPLAPHRFFGRPEKRIGPRRRLLAMKKLVLETTSPFQGLP